MIQRILITISIFFIVTATSNAADLIVRNGGAGGAYATISSAIAAATDGDRIIIRPKPSNVPYIEDIVVDKSLTFVSEIHTDNYEILGTFDIAVASGRMVTIHNLELVGVYDITTSGDITSGQRMQINLFNSNINDGDGDLLFNKANVSVDVVKCSFAYLTMVHGKVIANDCKSILVDGDGTIPTTDDIYIIANKIQLNNAYSAINNITIGTSTSAFHIYNNYMVCYKNYNDNIRIAQTKLNSTNYIQNNTFDYGSSSVDNIDIDGSGQFNVLIVNNILCAFENQIIVNNTDAYVQATYNMVRTFGREFTNVDFESSNQFSVSITYSDVIIESGPNENAGDPDSNYRDIDLTRNDIGRRGGSFSWDNYWSGGRPSIYFLNTPRIIFDGTTTFDANGIGTTN